MKYNLMYILYIVLKYYFLNNRGRVDPAWLTIIIQVRPESEITDLLNL